MVTCAVTTSFLGCLVTTCLYFRYTLCLNIGLLPRLLLFVPFLVAGVSRCWSLTVWKTFSVLFYPFYRYGLYFIFIGCIILFTVTLIADALFWLLSFTPLLTKFSFAPMAELGNFGLVPAVCGRGAVCRRQSTRGKECSYSSEKLIREYTVLF